MRHLLALAVLMFALPAAAQDWPDTTERKPLSARAQQITSPDYYVKGDDLAYAARELAACTNPPAKPDFCADVVLNLARPYEAGERPLIEQAVDTILARYPVDLFPLVTLRQPPGGDRMAGLASLALAKEATDTTPELACRNVRAQLALAIARWRMGGGAALPDRGRAAEACGADSPEAIADANAFAHLAAGSDPQALDAARFAHETAARVFGPADRRTAITAANRGVLLFERGSHAAAEPLLRAAFARLDTADDRLAARAALVPLAELLLELGRGDEARLLLASTAARDPALGAGALHVRFLTARAKLTAEHAAALLLFDQAVGLARAAAAEKPDPVLVEFGRAQLLRVSAAVRDMGILQTNIEYERQALEDLSRSRLATVLADQAARAFAAGRAALARDSAREARTLSSLRLHRAYLFEGLASLALGEGGQSEFLFGSAAIGLPPNHPDHVLIAMGMTYYQLGWNATYAPCYAKKATAAALARLDTDRVDSADNTAQFRSYSPVFRLQVAASWASAAAQQRGGVTGRTCPAGIL